MTLDAPRVAARLLVDLIEADGHVPAIACYSESLYRSRVRQYCTSNSPDVTRRADGDPHRATSTRHYPAIARIAFPAPFTVAQIRTA
jgi:hypothetical protein